MSLIEEAAKRLYYIDAPTRDWGELTDAARGYWTRLADAAIGALVKDRADSGGNVATSEEVIEEAAKAIRGTMYESSCRSAAEAAFAVFEKHRAPAPYSQGSLGADLGEDIQAYLMMDNIALDGSTTLRLANCLLLDDDWLIQRSESYADYSEVMRAATLIASHNHGLMERMS